MFQPLESMVHLFALEFSFLSGNCTDIFCYILKEFCLPYWICSTLISFVGFKVTCCSVDAQNIAVCVRKKDLVLFPVQHFSRSPAYTIILQYVYSQPFIHRKWGVVVFSCLTLKSWRVIQEMAGDAQELCRCLDQELSWGACGHLSLEMVAEFNALKTHSRYFFKLFS